MDLELTVACEPLAVSGRRSQLGQVLLNLVLNAIDACRDVPDRPHRIEVRAARRGNWVTMTVDDTGPGVSEALASRVFDPFFTTKPRGKGTGLGLAISKAIAAAHGGEIEVGRSPLGGARFALTIELPRARAATSEPAPSPAPSSGITKRAERSFVHRVGPRKVLLVDDDPIVLRSSKRVLARYDVVTAESVEEAKRLARGADFDVVVSDLQMPRGGGAELRDWLVETFGPDAPPVVFVTGGATSPDEEEYLRSSGCAVLLKPAPIADLVDAIDRARA